MKKTRSPILAAVRATTRGLVAAGVLDEAAERDILGDAAVGRASAALSAEHRNRADFDAVDQIMWREGGEAPQPDDLIR